MRKIEEETRYKEDNGTISEDIHNFLMIKKEKEQDKNTKEVLNTTLSDDKIYSSPYDYDAIIEELNIQHHNLNKVKRNLQIILENTDIHNKYDLIDLIDTIKFTYSSELKQIILEINKQQLKDNTRQKAYWFNLVDKINLLKDMWITNTKDLLQLAYVIWHANLINLKTIVYSTKITSVKKLQKIEDILMLANPQNLQLIIKAGIIKVSHLLKLETVLHLVNPENLKLFIQAGITQIQELNILEDLWISISNNYLKQIINFLQENQIKITAHNLIVIYKLWLNYTKKFYKIHPTYIFNIPKGHSNVFLPQTIRQLQYYKDWQQQSVTVQDNDYFGNGEITINPFYSFLPIKTTKNIDNMKFWGTFRNKNDTYHFINNREAKKSQQFFLNQIFAPFMNMTPLIKIQQTEWKSHYLSLHIGNLQQEEIDPTKKFWHETLLHVNRFVYEFLAMDKDRLHVLQHNIKNHYIYDHDMSYIFKNNPYKYIITPVGQVEENKEKWLLYEENILENQDYIVDILVFWKWYISLLAQENLQELKNRSEKVKNEKNFWENILIRSQLLSAKSIFDYFYNISEQTIFNLDQDIYNKLSQLWLYENNIFSN